MLRSCRAASGSIPAGSVQTRTVARVPGSRVCAIVSSVAVCRRTYPVGDSNLHPPRSERGASASWATRAWSVGESNPAGVACKRRCAPAPTPRASGRTRTGYLRFTRAAHHLSCCAGLGEPATGVEPAASRLQGERTAIRAPPASRALGASRTRTDQALDLAPLPVGLRGRELGAQDSNLDELLQRQPCCRLHQLPSRPPGQVAKPRPAASVPGGGQRGPR